MTFYLRTGMQENVKRMPEAKRNWFNVNDIGEPATPRVISDLCGAQIIYIYFLSLAVFSLCVDEETLFETPLKL